VNTSVSRANAHPKSRPWKSLLGLAAVLLFGVGQQAQAQSFGTCDGRMFMDQTDAALTLSTLNDVNYGTTPFTFTARGPASLARNGIGYNQVDNFIYGIEWVSGSGNELIRVASNGSSTNLGVITGLPVSNYNNGAISPTGEYYVMSGFGGTTLYRINLTTRVATSITLSSSIQVSDFAWHNGLLWAVNTGGTLVSVNPTTGLVTSIGSTTPVNTALAMWGFNNGLFASGGGSIYAIDPATGAATFLSTISPATNNGDGANCPGANIQFNADLSVTKTNTPASGPNDLPTDTYTPGETRTYSIVVRNTSTSFGAQNITVSDPIPAGINAATVSWTCANTSGGSRCGAASGTGALNDTGLDLPPNAVATYLVTMTVPTTFTGNLTNTVTITPPSTINDTNTANNTATDVDFPQPNFGTCDARVFLSQGPNPTTNTTLYRIDNTTNPMTFPTLGQASMVYNAIGYNTADNYLYGMANGAVSNELVRIGADGSAVNLGAVAGLPADNWISGTMGTNGVLYIMVGGGATSLYAVNVAARTASQAGLTSSVNASDIAWIGGVIYAVQQSDGQLKSINPTTGAVTNIGSPQGAITFGALYGSPSGLFGNSNAGGFYKIDLLTGVHTLTSGSPGATVNDGANCPTAPITFPSDLAITKADGNTTYTPGTNVVYTIVARNNGPFGAQNATVSDPLPAGITTVNWTCAATSGGSVCRTPSGSGAINTTLDLPVGAVATFTLTMAVPATFTGDLVNTATIAVGPGNTDPVPGNNSATDTNFPLGRLTIVKSVPSGQGTAFDFTQSGMPATAVGTPNASTATAFTLNPSVVAGSNLTAAQTYSNVPTGTAITVNELKSSNINQYSLVNIACTNAAGAPVGSTFPTSINNAAAIGAPVGTATITLVPGADVTCTFNNVRNPRIVIVKNTIGGNGTFTFTETSSAAGTSLSPASPINLVTSGGSATVNTTIAGLSGAATTNVTITEAVTAGFTLSSVNCTNLTTGTALNTSTSPSATVNLANREVVLGGVATGSEVQCTFVNTRSAQLQLRKTWVNARINDAVNIPATTGFATNTTVLNSVANTANESDSGTAVSVLVGSTGTLPTENFTTGSASNYTTTGWECRDGSTTLNVAQGGSLTIPASSAGTTLVCTLTNTRRQATLALSKTWANAVVNDTATLQSSGGVNTATLASTANSANETDTGATVAVFAGEVLTLSETLGAGNVGVYGASAWSCTGTTGLSGSTLTVAGADAAIVCRITNTRASANLSITKASTTTPVTAGGTITYSIVATNNGPSAANNAIVSDDWTTVPGLDCSTGTATCAASGTGGTQCPAPASVTPAALQAGLAIPVFPNGGIVTFTLQCTVTASGL
jgi:uncharacterized repeat protein (TIGR01451 family)